MNAVCPFCNEKMNHCIITHNFQKLLLEVTLHLKQRWIVIYHVHYYYYYVVPSSYICALWFPQNKKGDVKEEWRLRSDWLFHITFLLSLHLLGCAVCLRNRLLSALYQASNRQNHCKVRNKRSWYCYEIRFLKYIIRFTNEKSKDENHALCVSERNFPWWSLILNISFNMFHRKFLYIVDYLDLIMETAPRFTEMYATENYYYSHFLPTQNKRSSWPWVF